MTPVDPPLASSPPAPVPCPDCGGALPVVPAGACPHCGIRLNGPAAERLWWVDTTLRSLQAERVHLLATLRGEAAPAWPGAGPAPRPAGRPGAGSPAFTGQQVLLGLGALLVAVAGLVFVAVAWRRIGVAGQILLMAGVTVGVGVGADRAARRDLPQTAAWLAWLTPALFAIDAMAARSRGLLPDDVDLGVYVAAVAAAAVAGFTAVADACPSVPAFGVIALAFAQVPGLALAAAAGAAGPVVALVLLVQAWANVWAFAVLRGPARRPAAAFAGTALAAATVIALATSVDGPRTNQMQGILVGLAAAAAAVLWSTARPQLRFLAVLGGLVAGVELVVGADIGAGWQGRTGLAFVAAALLAWSYPEWRRVPDRLPTMAVLAGSAGGYLAAAWWLVADDEAAGLALALGALAAAAAVAVVVGRRPEIHPVAVLAWWATLAGVLHWGDVAEGPAGITLAVGACALFVAAWLAPDRGAEVATLVGAAVAALAAVVVATSGEPVHVAVALGLVGLAVSAYSQRPGFGPLVVVGVGLLTAGCWVLLEDASVEVVEAYTVPLAGLCLAAGLFHLVRHPDAGSWVTFGPAIVALLFPTAQVAVTDPGLTRTVLVLLVGGALVILGVHYRWQAPVVVAAPLVAEVALGQVGPLVAGVPRWISLGAIGVALLTAGATYEARLNELRRAGAWMRQLH